ncbi:MAG: hypothetical protein R6V58_11895 [Planctomycetota bacterium]
MRASELPRVRALVIELVAAAVAAWAGYFLAHSWQTLDEFELGLVLGGVLFGFGGARLARLRVRRARFGWAAAAVGLAALLAVDTRSFGAGLLVVAAGFVRPPAGPVPRLALGLLLGAGAGCAGLVSGRIPGPGAAVSVAALTAYVGLACAVRSSRPVGRGGLAVVLAGLVAGLIATAVLGAFRPMGLFVVVFAVWLLIYVAYFGVHALRRTTAERLELLGEHLLAGAGLFAAALLGLAIPEDGTAELAWPVLAGVFSMVVLRSWPTVRRGTTQER